MIMNSLTVPECLSVLYLAATPFSVIQLPLEIYSLITSTYWHVTKSSFLGLYSAAFPILSASD